MRWYASYSLVVLLILVLWLSSYGRIGSFAVPVGSKKYTVIASAEGVLKIGRFEPTVTGLGEGDKEVGRVIDQEIDSDSPVRFTRHIHLPQWPPLSRAMVTSSENILYENGVVITVTRTTKVTAMPWWIIFSVLAVPLLYPVVFSKHRLRKKRLAAGQCPECGYDIRVTPNRCPECGYGHEQSRKCSLNRG